MNLFTRITATVSSQVDKLVSQVENHDAIVEIALKDTRAAVAKARVRLERMRKDGKHMQQRLAELHRMEQLWADRALGIAATDEPKALECLARRNQSRDQAAHTQAALARHQEIETQVTENVRRMEQRLGELAEQQNLLRSRQSTAEAQRIISRIENTSANGIEDTFDRWEMLITETEYTSGGITPVDTLDSAFAKQENAAQLKAELDALLLASPVKTKE